ncbi:MAG TPA: hypothetical protein VKA70_11650 [Blastocatellia bacterium]|nr:hypothetical protein [Blastocatellia bacterium]
MTNTPDLASCLATGSDRSELTPLSPFHALRYHFGMLLGVDDFETEQAYHRAKMRLHNAWLHREGVVWGFDVQLDYTRGEIRVTPGLAIDAAGRELHLEADACVNVAEWFAEHEHDPNFHVETTDDEKFFETHVVVRFKACLTSQVPALMEPCEGAGSGTAYSRVFETVEILLLPNQAASRRYPYHRLRLLFGIDRPMKDETDGIIPEDLAVLDELERIRALPPIHQPPELVEAFHRFAALDEIDLRPATSEDGARALLFPGKDDDAVLLANITTMSIKFDGNRWALSAGNVDTSVRPTHVATTTIQDLLCGMLARTGGGAEGNVGPRVDPNSVVVEDSKIKLTFDKPLHEASVTAEAFSVTRFDTTDGWHAYTITASLEEGNVVALTLDSAPQAGLTRVVARGTGATPILGQDDLPIAGATTDPPAPQGADFSIMINIPAV